MHLVGKQGLMDALLLLLFRAQKKIQSWLPEKVMYRPAFQQFMNYSSPHGGDPNANMNSTATRIAADLDTHQDFEPKSRSSDMPLHAAITQDIKENPVLIYMKGFPESPMCGFSALAVKVFQQYGVPTCGRDILGDLKLKESVKAHT
ncbi:monothiol glutaredoxin-S1, mitochondrial isoform X2 [Zea mays]|uniref:monothiol glutaredoxin-S1, mitochondrial isoform X2 n=1 Tax=Zea mays TaxID=4577 RepID=UPI001652D1BD|nr:monothiol glutaredoxin-S1, mitochondrial-like isoform X2 [Zea mays]